MTNTDPDGQTPTGVVLGWIGTDVAVPEPTDLIPWKWVGYGAAIAGAAIIEHCAVKNISKAIEKSKTKDENQIKIYRFGSGNGTNLTPRPVKDDTGLSYSLTKPPAGIPYTETSIEEINATGVLNAVQDSPNHVSVKPNDMSTMIEWQASRENANTSPHEYTIILQSISKKGIE